MNKTVEVTLYNAKWPSLFERESSLIQSALGSNCQIIHHIGSTSILGLAAKPIIDIVPVVNDIELVARNIEPMQTLGYESRGEAGMLFRQFFQKQGFNVHIFEQGSAEIEGHLLFRDWMRAHTQDKEDYAQLKQSLALRYPDDIQQYVFGKDSFVRTIHAKTGFKGLRIVKALTPREWEAVTYYRNKYFFAPYHIDDPYTWTFHHADHEHFILYQGAEIIGYAHIQLWQDKRAALRMIAIDENDRNNHFGTTFLQLIEKWLKSNNIKSIHAESRLSSLNFYMKNAYTKMAFNDPDGYTSDAKDIPVGKIL